MSQQVTADSLDVYGKLNRRAMQFMTDDDVAEWLSDAEPSPPRRRRHALPRAQRFSEEADNQSRAFTQQCFAAVFDFGTPNRTYLSHQFGEEVQFALDDPNGPDVQLPNFLRGEGPQAWPEGDGKFERSYQPPPWYATEDEHDAWEQAVAADPALRAQRARLDVEDIARRHQARQRSQRRTGRPVPWPQPQPDSPPWYATEDENAAYVRKQLQSIGR